MSKHHFAALARALAECRGGTFMWERCILAVTEVCAASNPRFDRQRFLDACHGKE